MGYELQLVLFILLLMIATPLLGRYMAAVLCDEPTPIPVLTSLERSIYRICQIDPAQEMNWKQYAKAAGWFNLLGLLFLFLLQLAQGWLPLNPQGFPAVAPALAFNNAASFVTNTNWQSYGGEVTLSYLTQMLGMTVQNFLSAATGSAVLLAFIRGISRKKVEILGNFWVDVTRTLVYLLIPLSIIMALLLVSQGVIQNLHAYVHVTGLTGGEQVLPMGPAASQIAIKQLGTNGGGYFNANSAHPFENATPFSNFLEAFAILLIPAATTYMYGLLIKSRRQGLMLFSTMFILWIFSLAISLISQELPNPTLGVNPVLEGQEVRFGVGNSVLWGVNATATSNGSVNAMLSSLSPLTGGMLLFNMMLGELIFGGVGVGLASMLMFVILTVFLAGLMVGRTPEYLGKKIEKKEMQWVMLSILAPCALILIGTSLVTALPSSIQGRGNEGPHGFSEMLYAFTSTAANNGSSFAGLNANTYFYNIILGIVMLITRVTILLPSLAIAGLLVRKNVMAPSMGTFATDNLLFVVLLIGVILIVGALTFFPALSLGPIVEQILMLRGKAF